MLGGMETWEQIARSGGWTNGIARYVLERSLRKKMSLFSVSVAFHALVFLMTAETFATRICGITASYFGKRNTREDTYGAELADAEEYVLLHRANSPRCPLYSEAND